MKRIVCAIVISFTLVMTACGTAATPPPPTPDTQATVNAAVAATSTTQANMQATVDAAVAATRVSAPTPAATLAPMPTLMATPSVEYVTMTEEELAVLIDQAVADALAASQQCSTATTQAASDDVITQDELAAMDIYVVDAEQAIAYAEQLITAYYGYYGELATETIVLLQALEQDLSALAQNTAEINATLQAIEQDMEAGLALAEENIAKLEAAAQNISADITNFQTQTQNWFSDFQAELEKRAANVLAVQPNQIAADRQAAIQMAFDYLDAGRKALEDNKITPVELADIAQKGANATAGLNTQGGPQLQQASGRINEITGQMARGQLPQAKTGLGSFEAALGQRPSRRP